MKKQVFKKIIATLIFLISVVSFSQVNKTKDAKKATNLKYEFKNNQSSSLFLKAPKETIITYDDVLGKFVLVEKIGEYQIGTPIFMSPKEYDAYRLKTDIHDYFKERVIAQNDKTDSESKKDLLPKYYVNSKFFESIFGGTEVEVIPSGQVNVKLGLIYQKTENPQVSVQNQTRISFDFDQQIGASLQAKVGKRLRVTANYDTQSTFDFQNIIKLEYTPDEDDIIQKLDAGNINLPINNSLINGAQSLFGVRADFQFGRTTIRTAFSQQNSQAKTVVAQGGAVIEPFELRATDYDNDRHFFLSQYFRESYANALKNYPLVSSPVQITRVEVWVTNTNQNVQDYRSIVAFADIGETNTSPTDNNLVGQITPENITSVNVGGKTYNLPSNDANNLNNLLTADSGIRDASGLSSTIGIGTSFNMTQGSEYTYLQNARKLQPNEFRFHPQLGYISLNRRLNDGEVLAVAFEYTAVGTSTGVTTFKVGEFSNDGINAPSNLAVKLLRSEILKTTFDNDPQKVFPTWRLMMKNIYAIGAFPLQQEGFRFELMYRDDTNGILQNTFQNSQDPEIKNKVLLSLMNVDKLDQSQYAVPNGDGFFDFVEDITVNSQRGLIIFPETEPFGVDLKNKLTSSQDQKKYVFDQLYLTTKAQAKNEFQNKDKFFLKGYFKSETSRGISLGAFNIPRGSVHVTAGGRQLVEGVDYVVDYQLGRVQILDPGLEASGIPINARVENNTFFNQQQKTFIGVDVEHKVSENFIIGGTFLNVSERPITPKVNFGTEPIDNVMLGLNFDYAKEVPFLTKLTNKLPFVDTDAPSNISVRGDFAYLLPGSPSGIDINGTATAYVDDFEASQIPINLSSPNLWYLSSTPNEFGGDKIDDLSYNDKRAKLAWYNIDQLFYTSSSNKPSNINDIELSRDEVRQVSYSELFPNTDLDLTQLNLVRTLDLAYYPSERGPYNFNKSRNEVKENPEENWAGIMRPLTTNNFEQANVEYVQFWLLDPYENYSITEQEGLPSSLNPNDLTNQVGKLRINLGNLSEDILRDGFKQYENGLTTTNSPTPQKETAWGNVPQNQSILYSFSADNTDRTQQDIGLDGLNDQQEKAKFPDYADLEDPSGDNFKFFRGSDLDAINASILTRYKNFNGTQGNSPTASQSNEAYPTSSTSYPDVEDINKDQTMNTTSGYFEYEVSMNKSDFQLGKNYIVDEKTENITLANGATRSAKWYQFRIPVRTGFTNKFNISDFNSIRFMRMYLTGFKMPIVLRLGELELVRGDWRRYTKIIDDGVTPLPNAELNKFEVGVASIEQNNETYAIPPGVSRELLQGTNRVQRQNEQSVTVKVTDLEKEETRLIYKNIRIDLRRYSDLKMFLHAESIDDTSIQDNEIAAVIRIGTDLNDNYYEIEKPLTISEVSSNPSELQVWPQDNNLDVILKELAGLKLIRDGSGLSASEIYEGTSTNGLKIRLKGNPTLAQIQTVMLGVKNLTTTPRSVELWFNELRAVGFDNKGGWASVINANMNFADVANLSVAGSLSTVGFGNVDQRVQERSLDENKQYSISSSVEVAKVVTPKNWHLQVPMTYTYGEEFRDPKYNPQYQDLTQDQVKSSSSASVKSKAENSQDYTKRKGISFINVKKNRNPNSEKKPKFYDIENLAVSYSFNEEYHQDYNIKSFLNQNMMMGASYNFSFKPWSIEPFKNSKFLKNKYLKLFKDFNVNIVPKTFSINSRINRNYSSQQSRNLIQGFSDQPILKQRRFMFDWDYTIGFDLTKSLQLNFNATNNHIYDSFGQEEPEIFDKLMTIGRPNHYHQTLNATYKLPLQKIPFLSFISSDYVYTADFDWQASSKSPIIDDNGVQTTIEAKVGNMVQNSSTHNINTSIDFRRLYKTLGVDKLFATRVSRNQPKRGGVIVNGKSPKKNNFTKKKSGNKFLRTLLGVLTSVQQAKINYSENNGTLLQGYKPSVGLFGLDSYNGNFAPTLGFALGSQSDIIQRSIQNNWLVSRKEDEQYYNKNYSKTKTSKLNYNISLKPLKTLTIDLRANRIKTSNLSSQLDVINTNSSLVYDASKVKQNNDVQTFETGNYSSSHFMLGTMFTNSEVLFNKFKTNRSLISNRLATDSRLPNSQSVSSSGFKLNGQQTMLPAFLAAYSGVSADKVNLNIFRSIPVPGWTIRFNGLMKKKWFKKNFSSFTLSHGYKSSYTIANFTNNLQYDASSPQQVNASYNYQPELLIANATLIDEFSPLVRVDMRMKNSLSVKGEVKKDRSLALNFNNNTLTDIKGTEYVLGLGYKIKDVKFRTRIAGKKKTLKGDLNLRADISFRDNLSLIRSIDEENNQITGGETLFGLKFLADYNLTKNITASFYYNHNTFDYAISTTFPRQSVNAGINVIYRLGN